MISGLATQDTIKPGLSVRINTGNLIPDSVFRKMDEKPAHLRLSDSGKTVKYIKSPVYDDYVVTDTTSVCSRNFIADITFTDSLNFVAKLGQSQVKRFPFTLTEAGGSSRKDLKEEIITILNDGRKIPEQPFRSDWIVVIIFIAAYLFILVRSTAGSLMPGITKFLLFRGINEPSSKDISSLFYWQSTVLNFISFLVIALFLYCAAIWYDLIPSGIPHFLLLLIITAVIAVGITLRHLICITTGNLSGQKEAFNEYLIGIYNFYRFSSIFISMVIVMLLYTLLLPAGAWITAGFIVLGFMYLNRILRLFLIFIKRDISILYLILYLCALEILPGLILIKYFTGLG